MTDGPAPQGAFDEYRYAIDVDAQRHGDHGWLAELDELTVHAGPPYQRMGTRAIPVERWFVLDRHAPEQRRLRARLLDERPDDVFACPPGAEAAARETCQLVGAWLAAHGPPHPGPVDRADAHDHPLAAAALGVQDDLCLMQRDEDGWRLTAGVLCFPTYWRLRDKLGRVQQAVHGPVPHYADDLAARVSRFFDRLAPNRIVCRRNWGFSPHPLLFVPDRSLAPPDPDAHDVTDLWLRSERQTLRRLPDSGAILFGIRIQLAPLPALAAHPDLCRRLADAVDAWSPELVESRGGRHGHVAEVVGWLRGASRPSG